jgi:excinuclease ABC subunit C
MTEATASQNPSEDASPQVERPSLQRGFGVIKNALRDMPNRAGCYVMRDDDGVVLYVGKATALAKRVRNYANPTNLPNRIVRMISETATLTTTVTNSEAEALLLENNLIKSERPKYNILFRDDKSFPYIELSRSSEWPMLSKHRGEKKPGNVYYGPFASAGAVESTIVSLQKAFQLRSCSEHMFRSRTRPCLLHQIKRCTAPCVGNISTEDYADSVEAAKQFLVGGSNEVRRSWTERMQTAAEKMEFEQAAIYRDRLRALSHVQARQGVNVPEMGDSDLFALARHGDKICILVWFFRAGQNQGGKPYFQTCEASVPDADIMDSFLAQFYHTHPVPKVVVLSQTPTDSDLLHEALSLREGRRISLLTPQRGPRRRVVEQAIENALHALKQRLNQQAGHAQAMAAIAKSLDLERVPERVEVYDNSHLMGTHPMGGMVVYTTEGWLRRAFRRFKIGKHGSGTAGDDDFAMLREVLLRRLSKLASDDPDVDSHARPDLLLLDGGKGQFSAARAVLEELGLTDIAMIAISKGPDRDAGLEQFVSAERGSFRLAPTDPALMHLQRLRDEAHRFAIGAHRQARQKATRSSQLDSIPGIGPKRKKQLLLHFGSVRAVSRASVDELSKIGGINQAVAQKIYDALH